MERNDIRKFNGLKSPLWSGLHSPLFSSFDGSALAGGQSYASIVSNGALAPYVTFTRADASSCATYFDSAGVMQIAAANEPRIDYDPSTLALRGLLVEESRTNLLTYSAQFDNAAWTKTEVSISANAAVAPDGTATADYMIESAANSTHIVRRSITFTAGSHTLSVYAKQGVGSERSCTVLFNTSTQGVTVNLSTGAILNTINTPTVVITDVGGGWWKISVTATIAAGTQDVRYYIGNLTDAPTSAWAGDGTSGIYIWGAQLEAGAFATSYIPTTSAAVTRAADVAVVSTLANIGYNTAEGTVYAEFDVAWAAAGVTRVVVGIDANGRHIYSSGSLQFDNYDGVNILTGPFGLGLGGTNKTASAWGGSTKSITTNGAAVSSGSFDGSMGAGSTLQLGRIIGAGAEMCGHIKTLRYYPRRLTDAELQALTA